jgi:hypothetical protein
MDISRKEVPMHTANELIGWRLLAKDGEIGRCKDFLVDDRHWTIRYMVADTGTWLPGRRVLISPISLGEPEWEARRFPVKLTQKQIEASPPLERDAPVSRRYETVWFEYYGWPSYWVGGGLWGPAPYPAALYGKRQQEFRDREAEIEQSHLRSAKELTGYHIQAKDREIGHVEDFLVDDTTWTLRYMVVDTRNWLPGRKVLIPPAWLDSVSWADRTVRVDLTADTVEKSPEYDPSKPVKRTYETRLYRYYGQRPHWE